MPSRLQRIRSELKQVGLEGLDPSAYRGAADRVLRAELDYDIAAWATLDPATMIDTSCLLFPPIGHDAQRERAVFQLEADGDDYLLHRDLARGELAGAVFLATGGHPERCRRFRELFSPMGGVDELRIELVADGNCWGHVAAHRMGAKRTPFGEDEVDLARAMAPVLGSGLRLSLLNAGARLGSDIDGPGWLLLDGADGLIGSSPAGERWLAELAPPGQLPVMLASLATAVRAGEMDTYIEAPTRSGGWVALHGSRARGLEDDSVAVVIEPKRRPRIASELTTAYGITAREQEVMSGVLRGLSTKELAAELGVSLWTVQDHLKAVFNKFGVHSRSELAARIFDDHIWPRDRAGHQPGPYGWFLDEPSEGKANTDSLSSTG
jgi:DNA-binding CsgD family transcriptional regulator